MVTTASHPYDTHRRFSSVKASFVTTEKIPQTARLIHRGKSRGTRGGSQGADIDARINSALLQRKTLIPPFPIENVQNHVSGVQIDLMSRDADIPSCVESRETRDSSRGTDVDACINSMLLQRKTQLPSYPIGNVQNHASWAQVDEVSRDAHIPSSHRNSEVCNDEFPGSMGIGVPRHLLVNGIDKQLAPAGIQSQYDNFATEVRETATLTSLASPQLCPKVYHKSTTSRGTPHAVSELFKESRLAHAVVPELLLSISLASSPSTDETISTANSGARVDHIYRESVNNMGDARMMLSGLDSCSDTFYVTPKTDSHIRNNADMSRRSQDAYVIDIADRQFPSKVALTRLPPNVGALSIERSKVDGRPHCLDNASSEVANNDFETQPSLTWNPHAGPNSIFRLPSVGNHHPTRKSSRSSSQTFGVGTIERPSDKQPFNDFELIGYHDHDIHSQLDVQQTAVFMKAYNHAPAPTRRDTPWVKDDTRGPSEIEHATDAIPNLEKVLDCIDEIASPMLAGKSILYQQREHDHLALEDPMSRVLDCVDEIASAVLPGVAITSCQRLQEHHNRLRHQVNRDELSQYFTFAPMKQYEESLTQQQLRELGPSGFLNNLQKRIDWMEMHGTSSTTKGEVP